MWLLFGIISIAFYTFASLLGAKLVKNDSKNKPFELRFFGILVGIVAALIILIFNFGESGRSPFEILSSEPILIASVVCTFLSELLYFYALKFIGLSLQGAIGNASSINVFFGLILINICNGTLSQIKTMFHPLRIVFIVLTIISLILFPAINSIGKKEKKIESKKLIIGIVIALAATILDAGDSLITSPLLEAGKVGPFEMVMTQYIVASIFLILIFGYLCFKNKQFYNPFKKNNLPCLLYGVLFLGGNIFYILSAHRDAVRINILFFAYPIFPVLAGILLLKERYSLKQYITLGLVLLSTTLFVIFDYLITSGVIK